MKNLLYILLFFLPFTAHSQLLSGFHGYGDVLNTTVLTDSTFSVEIGFEGGYYNGGQYTADSILVGDGFFIDCGYFLVDYIVSKSTYTAEIIVKDTSITLAPPSILGRFMLYRPTSNSLLTRTARIALGVAGISATEYNCIINHLISQLDAKTSSASLTSFDGNRPIVRVPEAGDNLGTTTVNEWLEWWYQGPPTLSLTLSPSTTVYEVGDSLQIILNGATSNPSGATLSSGQLNRTNPDATTLVSFGSSTTVADTIQFVPTKGSTAHYKQLSYSFRSQQSWVSGGDAGIASSQTRSVTAVYPVLYGTSAIDSLGVSSGDPYTALSKLIEREGNKTIVFNGATPSYLYMLVPNTWGDVDFSLILDHNDFPTTGTWKKYTVQVSSTGLTNNWTNVSYTCYQWPILTTATNFDYEFRQ